MSCSFGSFKEELTLLVEAFHKNLSYYKSSAYDEPALRNDFLNRLWRALGWDLENRAALPQSLREVELETRVEIRGRKKRADYIFRTDGIDRFVCEAKKPKEELTSKYAYQVQRYAFNLKVLPALLSDFEELHVFIVGGKPDREAPWEAYFQWYFLEYLDRAQQIWDLLARENVAVGALDRFVASLPKKAVKGKPRQGWLIPRKRQRMVDAEFLTYIEEQREALAYDLVRENKKYPWDEPSLNEVIQRILDRILFVRICEDRDIDTGRSLERIVEEWQSIATGRQPLYPRLVGHFQSLDEPFNGALFRRGHESEKMRVSDAFLVNLIVDLSSEDSPYLFNTLPVEIIGSVYERFIGKVVRVTRGGRVKIELKPEVRKAGGIYYTPSYIVHYIVEHTVGELLKGRSPKEVAKLKVLDPASGSGSFLIRAFERICEHYLKWFRDDAKREREDLCYRDNGGNLHLTTHLKRQIMLNNIFGVDLDPQAVEVTMLSLYLKILEGETRSSLGRQQRLFPKESFLPNLSKNIHLGNSLIEDDYFDLFTDEEERTRIRPLDWRAEFTGTIKAGGFDAVIGNPPYVRIQNIREYSPGTAEYLQQHYESAKSGNFDIYVVFLEKALQLINPRGLASFILPNKFMHMKYGERLRKKLAAEKAVAEVVDFADSQVFGDGSTYTCILRTSKAPNESFRFTRIQADPNELPGALKNARFSTLSSSELGGGPWALREGTSLALFRKCSGQFPSLGELSEKIFQGVITGADPVFLFEDFRHYSKRLVEVNSKASSRRGCPAFS